jgi:hypothetical protein
LGPWLGILAALATLAAPLSAMAQTPSRVTRIWKQLQAEAGIALVLQAAAAHAPRSHLAAFKTRSRWYAALPKRVSLRLQKHQEDGWRGTLYDDEGWSQRNRRDARMGWRVEAEWALSELIYTPMNWRSKKSICNRPVYRAKPWTRLRAFILSAAICNSSSCWMAR